jgi:hypothetical protein
MLFAVFVEASVPCVAVPDGITGNTGSAVARLKVTAMPPIVAVSA